MININTGSDQGYIFETYRNELELLRPIDDDFMRILFRNNLPLAQKVLQIIAEMPDLKLETVETQADLKIPGSRSVELDVLCKSDKGKIFDLEAEKNTETSTPVRARYHASVIDIKQLKPGAEFDVLQDVFIIFVTKKDIGGKGLPRYYVRQRTGKISKIADGTCILFANAQYQDDSEFGLLMADYLETRPERMRIKEMRDACYFYKRTDKGRQIMCAVFEEIKAKGREEGLKEGRAEERKNTLRERQRADKALKEVERLREEIRRLTFR